MNLRELLKNTDHEDAARALFPNNRHPVRALKRVLSGKCYLDTRQVHALAVFLDVRVKDLFDPIRWRSFANKNVIAFYRDDFIARLDTRKWITKVYDKDKKIHDGIIHGANVKLSDYIFELNKICNYDND